MLISSHFFSTLSNQSEEVSVLFVLYPIRFGLETRTLWWVTAQFSRNPVNTCFWKPLPLWSQTLCFPSCLSPSRSAAQAIDSSPHLVFENWFSSILILSYCSLPRLPNFTFSVIDTCPAHLALAHWNISSACPIFLF